MSQPSSQKSPTRASGADVGDFVEVYVTDNDLVAGLVCDEILGANGIASVKHDRRSRAIVAPASMSGAIGIAVSSSDAARALDLLRSAQTDGMLQDDGDVTEEGIA